MPKALLQNQWLELGLRWALGLTFAWSSVHKIADPARFAKIVYGYDLFPGVAINAIAIVLPYVEVIVGVSLMLGIYPRSGALTGVVLLLMFAAAVSINLIRGHDFDCGCFSFEAPESKSSSGRLLLRQLLLAGAGIWVLAYGGHRKWALRSTGGLFHTPPPGR
jgi:uncharacterized membrane protein YphA (DoxX/SURF4 family)